MLNDRRAFIRDTTLAILGFGLMPRGVKAFYQPGDQKVRLGFIGVGLRGQTHLAELTLRDDVEIIAMHDPDANMVAMAQQLLAKANRPKAMAYVNGNEGYLELLRRKDIDAVIISSPWEWHVQQGIAALGAVNLAALEELAVASERKVFLDAQTADLQEAMNTLEDAIRKIDGETRQLLSGTFDAVNQHFGRMFPELFGGGNARLIVTGDEILDSGVQVMAQPPGKKNQTIHLLSGGEKALTAIALVFAIFQLNPAPFCLLDEVDAPLDDANTERYARLVTSMSHETQFLFISHNKIAMEMAQQLIGVTMQEQGVSRIVAVDMESALSMAST